jgi:hypothetical protein
VLNLRTSVKIKRNDGRLIPFVGRVSDASAKHAAEATQRRARDLAPKRTGRLANSIEVQEGRSALMRATYRVGSPLKYALYQEKGTRAITARPGGVLAFSPRGGGGLIFRRRTRGVPAVRFMERAHRQITRRDFIPDRPVKP